MWVKWVLTDAKTVLSFVITLRSAKKSTEWEGPKERGRARKEHPLVHSPAWRWQNEAGRKQARDAAVPLDPVLRDSNV